MAEFEGPWGGPRPPAEPPPRRRPPTGLLIWVGLMALAVGAFALLAWRFPGQLAQGDGYDALRIFGMLALVSSGLVYARRVNVGQTARHIAVWGAVVGALAVGYAYRGEIVEAARRVRAELIPGQAARTGAHEMVIAQSADGFAILGAVNGAPVRFIIDTGASDIVLSPDDARRAGVDMASLDFARGYETANGAGRGARVVLKSLQVGQVHAADVEASVNAAPMRASLLGMAFLKRFESIEVRGGRLVLRWRG